MKLKIKTHTFQIRMEEDDFKELGSLKEEIGLNKNEILEIGFKLVKKEIRKYKETVIEEGSTSIKQHLRSISG